MEKKTFLCDMCRSQRGEANHWTMARENEEGGITFAKWNDEWATRAKVKHLCGQQCAHQLLDEFLSK